MPTVLLTRAVTLPADPVPAEAVIEMVAVAVWVVVPAEPVPAVAVIALVTLVVAVAVPA